MSRDVHTTLWTQKCVFAKSMHFKIVSHTKLAVFISPRVRFILAWCFVVNGLAGTGQLLENVVDAALLCSQFEPHVTEGLFRLFPPHYVITITGTHHIETFLKKIFLFNLWNFKSHDYAQNVRVVPIKKQEGELAWSSPFNNVLHKTDTPKVTVCKSLIFS